MVRPYKMKGTKRKKRKDNYELGEVEEVREAIEKIVEEAENVENAAAAEGNDKEEVEEEANEALVGIPVGPVDNQSDANRPGVIVILEKASLEVAKVGKKYELLNSDKHQDFLRRNGRDPADYRPDIAYQAILMVLDSRINKSGRLKALYVRTQKGVLFEIKPHCRMPRTYSRFTGIMLQLLQKMSITAAGKREKLLRVIQNPVTKYLPINSRKIGFSHSSEKIVDIQDYVAGIRDDMDLVFVFGAMAHGRIEKDYVEDYISISEYPLSAAYCIGLTCAAVERKWKIL